MIVSRRSLQLDHHTSHVKHRAGRAEEHGGATQILLLLQGWVRRYRSDAEEGLQMVTTAMGNQKLKGAEVSFLSKDTGLGLKRWAAFVKNCFPESETVLLLGRFWIAASIPERAATHVRPKSKFRSSMEKVVLHPGQHLSHNARHFLSRPFP